MVVVIHRADNGTFQCRLLVQYSQYVVGDMIVCRTAAELTEAKQLLIEAGWREHGKEKAA